VVAAAAEAVSAEDHDGMEGGDHFHRHVVGLAGGRAGGEALRGGVEVGEVDVDDGACEFAGGRVVFGADGLDLVELVEGGGAGDAFGEDADGGFIGAYGAGCGVAAHDVVVEHGFEIPAFGFG